MSRKPRRMLRHLSAVIAATMPPPRRAARRTRPRRSRTRPTHCPCLALLLDGVPQLSAAEHADVRATLPWLEHIAPILR
jgi:hypothetical protein